MIENSVTIIIPIKNGRSHLRQVFDAIKKQNYDAPVDVICVDSGSKDGSDRAVLEYGFQLLRISPEEFGHGRTRNYAAQHAKSQFLVFLTQDAIPADTTWLSELVKPMRDDEAVAGVFSRHIAHDSADAYTAWELQQHFEGLKDFQICEIVDENRYNSDQGLRQVFHYFSDNASAIRKSVWRKHPLADVQFAEDQIWAKTIIEAGYKKAFAYNSVVKHSHAFGPIDTLRRSFDEARAFKQLFGYDLGHSRSQILKSTLHLIRRDLALAFKKRFILRHPLKTISRIIEAFAKPTGHYFGARSDTSKKVQNLLSRDQCIKSLT